MVIFSFMIENSDIALDHIKEKVKLDKAFIEPKTKVIKFSDRLTYLITAKDYVVPRFSFILIIVMCFSFATSYLFGKSLGIFNTLLIIVTLFLLVVMIIETLARTPNFSFIMLKLALIKNGYIGQIRRLTTEEGVNAALYKIQPKFKKEV